MQVVVAGGGTAGHVEPALALADAVRRVDPGSAVIAIGTARGLETRLVPGRGYPLELIPPVPLPRSLSPDLLRVPARLRVAVNGAAAVLRDADADVLVGFGGYVALPAYLAARRLGVPFVVHEANARPGLANRLGARLTAHVAGGLPGCRLPHARYVGIPLRPQIAALDPAARQPGQGMADRAAARAEFGLRPDRPTLLVFGGSQGARAVNRAAAAAAPAARDLGVQVLHVAGRDNDAAVRADVERSLAAGSAAPGPPYQVIAYVDRMDLAYTAADLALCRCGAMTCAELAAVGLPAAFVPYPVGNGEQRFNAEPLVRAGGALLVRDEDLTGAWVTGHVLPLAADPARLAAMSAATATLGRRDADETLARMVLDVAAEGARARADGSRPRSTRPAGSTRGAGPA